MSETLRFNSHCHPTCTSVEQCDWFVSSPFPPSVSSAGRVINAGDVYLHMLHHRLYIHSTRVWTLTQQTHGWDRLGFCLVKKHLIAPPALSKSVFDVKGWLPPQAALLLVELLFSQPPNRKAEGFWPATKRPQWWVRSPSYKCNLTRLEAFIVAWIFFVLFLQFI